MAKATRRWYIIVFTYFYSIGLFVSASSSPVTCHPRYSTFLEDLRLQCLLSIPSSSSIEMDGETLDQVLNSKPADVHTAVLFYALWCPFSSGTRYKFDVLGSMFPQIEHIAVEQSSSMPSMFSRYGVHSVPALLIVNQTAKVRYHGPKNLLSMAQYYKKTTGLDPVEDLTHDYSSNLMSYQKSQQPWYQLSWNVMIVKEPYIVFSVLFVLSRAFLYFCPGILSWLAAAWVLYCRHMYLGILGEARQLLWRILHLIDIKRVRSRLKLCETRNFQRGARGARVWASSLASVSLGETSSVRP